tara:strand:- start:206736 stop:207158 length:423 start_codon:yes stop_codon:yes gene_type:complete
MDVGVFAFIKNKEDKILLVKDVTRQQLWTLPGGGPDFQELMPDALVREVKEETGCGIKLGQLLGIFSQKKTQGIVILFDAHIESGEPTSDGVETAACEFFSYEKILEMREQIKPAQLSMISQVISAQVYPVYNHFISPQS